MRVGRAHGVSAAVEIDDGSVAFRGVKGHMPITGLAIQVQPLRHHAPALGQGPPQQPCKDSLEMKWRAWAHPGSNKPAQLGSDQTGLKRTFKPSIDRLVASCSLLLPGLTQGRAGCEGAVDGRSHGGGSVC